MCKCNASINGLHVLVMFEQDGNGQIGLFWGIAADGSVVISENLELNKARCFMFKSEIEFALSYFSVTRIFLRV
jgi:hypothetical protein